MASPPSNTNVDGSGTAGDAARMETSLATLLPAELRPWAVPTATPLPTDCALVKDEETKEPFHEAGALVYQKAFRKGLAWIPAGNILRMSPPIVMDDVALLKGLDIIDEAIGETARELG